MLLLSVSSESADELGQWCRQRCFPARRLGVQEALVAWGEAGTFLLGADTGILDALVAVSEYADRHRTAARWPLVVVDSGSCDVSESRALDELALRLVSCCWVSRVRWPQDAAALERLLRQNHTQRSVEEGLSRVVHELATPVATVRTWCTLLERTREGVVANLEHTLPVVNRSVKQMLRCLEDLRAIGRSEGPVPAERAEVDVNELAAAAVASFAPLAQQSAISLELSKHETPALVLGDEVRLLQVFNNLMSNGLKFTPARGRVSVSVGVESGHVVARVEDNGVGIAPERLPLLFERIAGGSGSGGMGLGLCIARDIVERHHGTVTAHSDGIGSGARFEFSIPVHSRG